MFTKTLFAGGVALAVDLLLKLDVCAGIWKFQALFAKNGDREVLPLNILNQFWSSYSSGTKGGYSSLMLGTAGGGPSPVPGLEGNKFPSSPEHGGNKFPPSLLLLLPWSSLLFFLLGFFMSRNL